MIHPSVSKNGRFFFAPIIAICEWLGNNHPEILLRLRYWYTYKKKLNLKNPKNLNEKILWAKLYSDTTKWTELADKYKVREYVKNKGLEDTLVKLYAVWYKKEDICFENLPDSFIIKANNGDGKGTNKIVYKSELTKEKKKELIALVDEWLNKKNIGALSAEPQYKGIPPCVIVEELLPIEEGETTLTDYKIWCFNGKAYCTYVCSDRSKDGNSARVMLYDINWVPLPEGLEFTSDYPKGDIKPKPKNYDQMIQIAETLSQGFPELRVDLYNINGKIYFGELTFTSDGGLTDFTLEYSEILGTKFEISDFPLKKK